MHGEVTCCAGVCVNLSKIKNLPFGRSFIGWVVSRFACQAKPHRLRLQTLQPFGIRGSTRTPRPPEPSRERSERLEGPKIKNIRITYVSGFVSIASWPKDAPAEAYSRTTIGLQRVGWVSPAVGQNSLRLRTLRAKIKKPMGPLRGAQENTSTAGTVSRAKRAAGGALNKKTR